MKRFILVVFGWLLGLSAVQSQSVLSYRYWYDQDVSCIQSGLLGDGSLVLDANGLEDGLHTLNVVLEGDALIAPQRYMFLKVSPHAPNPMAGLSYRYWYDQDVSDIRSGILADGSLVLDANGLEDGLHTLNVVLEGDALIAPQRYMFLKVSPHAPNPMEELHYRYWYDQDVSDIRSGLLADGSLVLDANGLEDGLHTLNVVLEGDALIAPQRYMFLKVSPHSPNPMNELHYRYWYDQDVSDIRSGILSNGSLLLDANGLEDGQHTLHIMLETDCLMASQSYDFAKSDTIPVNFAIVATANPVQGGAVSGAGSFSEDDICTLIATPNDGFSFGNWTENGEEVSANSEYSFIVSNSRMLVANFDEETICTNYFFSEDTILCDAVSYEWRGNTYTESGIYYDSLLTAQGCDSIFQLSLEFFDTPLGEFTYMSPTDDYPFTALPIIFSWDAVSGAEYYNLYLWEANEPAPDVPVSSHIYNRSYVATSLQNHKSYQWYVEAVNACYSTASSTRSFSLDIPPTMAVSIDNLDFGEIVLNDSVTLSLYVSGNALNEAISLQIMGDDAASFSYSQGSNWDNLLGGSLSVTFSPSTVQYNYNADLVITCGTLSQTVHLSGSLTNMFVFNTYVEQDVYEMNSTIPIFGTVMDAYGNPVPSAEVEVKVCVMNTTRTLYATTDNDGHFSVNFVPVNSESGYYTINSGRVGGNSTAIHDDFNIPGMNLVSNDWIYWDVVQNETTTGSIVIRNRSQIPLTDIQVSAYDLPEGCSFTFQPLSLQGMEEGVLDYSVTGSVLTSGNNYEEVRLVATSAEGAMMNFSAWFYCSEPRGILYASPASITTTMTKGTSKIVDVMLCNNGTGPTGSVFIDIPSEEWLSVVGDETLPSIAVHDSAYFSIRLSANQNTPLVQYTGNIAINCERGDGLLLPFTITTVSDSTGILVVDVTDDYTYNGNGEHLSGATVTVKGYYSLETVAIGLTDSNGLFTVENIPEGYYRMSVTAPHHAEYQATILIEGGKTNTQNIYLQYQAITYSWNVVPTEIEDEYSFEMVVVFETNVPVPVITIEMPEDFPELEEGESFVFDYIITNHGLINSYNATLYPPTGHPLYDFNPLITEIDTIRAQETIEIPCTMTKRTSQRSQRVMEILNGKQNRDDECPFMARTSIISYYVCGGERKPIYGYRLVNIGSVPCGSVVFIPDPNQHEHDPLILEPHVIEPVPPITWQQHGCSDDPSQSEALDELNSCPPQFDTTPKLPPVQPGNNRQNN